MINIKKLNKPVVSFTSGKADYIKKKSKLNGNYEDVCLCKYNIDLSTGCPSNTNPKTRERNATKYNCSYCYARRTNYHEPIPWKIKESVLEKQIEENDIKIARIGKTVECGYKRFRGRLIKFLLLCNKHNIQAIMPTKYLEYDKQVARLLRETNSALFYSIGADKYEIGACLHGCNNDFRLEQARKYLSAGVNVGLKLIVDLTVSPEEADERGWHALKALNSFPKERIELLPLRIKAKKFAREVTGESWDMLQKPLKKEEHLKLKEFENMKNRPERYVMEQDVTMLVPNYIHPDYFYFIEKKQICGHIGTKENGVVYCDKCLLTGKDGKRLEAVSFQQSELPEHPGTVRKKEWLIDKRERQRMEKKQIELKLEHKAYQQKLNLG